VLGCAAFLAACGAHYFGYQRFLGARLNDPDPGLRRAALIAWARFAIAWQLGVLGLAAAWLVLVLTTHPRGYAWAAPPAGLILGAALPLQLVVIRISRAGGSP
jgi:hypothetical protein